MKIAIAQLNYKVGDLQFNVNKAIDAIDFAKKHQAELIIFSELSVCGYPPKDLLSYETFLDEIHLAVDQIAQASQNIACIVGAPTRNKHTQKLKNSALFIQNGKLEHVVHKTLLPDYDVFDESRHFESNDVFEIIKFKGRRIALTVCEDIWNEGEQPLYKNSPMDFLSKSKPDLMINIAASPFDYNQSENRRKVLTTNALKYQLPIVYVNQVGANTELIFDGDSTFVSAQGEIISKLPSFQEKIEIIDTENQEVKNQSTPSTIEKIHEALVFGIKDYFQKMGFQKAVLGLSGGIDSAVVCALVAEALGAQNVTGILLPSKFSSQHSIDDAQKLAENIGCKTQSLPVNNVVEALENTLYPFFKDTNFGIAEENIQARSRGVLLMALSNKFGWILVNTTNKSELAVGYGTLYGDMCGGLSVLGDVYKTQVYKLAEYINREKEIIPKNTIIKPPSAELKPNQKDSDSLPDYEVLDAILKLHIEEKKTLHQIIAQGFDKEIVSRILRLTHASEHKRYQAAPVLRVSPKAFSVGRKIPIVASFS